MSTVTKAVSLLEALGADAPEAGLGDLARRAGFDKTTTRRLLMSLIDCGLVEQDERSRNYRLGSGIARLALMREAQFPFLRTAAPLVERLAGETGETAHVSEYSRRGLVSVHVVESERANRIFVPLGELLPLHATASGIAFLAFAEAKLRDAVLAAPLPAYTAHTIADPTELARRVGEARRRGYSVGEQGFEEGVDSAAAAILDAGGRPVGAIAVAAPRSRVARGDLDRYGALASAAAREIGERLYGRPAPPARARAS